MSFVAQLGQLAVAVPPHVVTATVLFLATIATLLTGLVRRGRGFLRHLPSITFMLVGSAAFWTVGAHRPAAWTRAAVTTAAGALLIEMVLAYRERVDPRACGQRHFYGPLPLVAAECQVRHAARDVDLGSERMARRYLVATLAVVAALLFYHLGTYSGALLTWEAPVVAGYPNIGGFAHADDQGQGVIEFAAQRFLWDEGLLSAGDTSLFYGAPTYALFQLIGFSPWSLRVAAVIATLLSVALIYVLARRFFGPVVGAAAAAALGLNSCVLFYGRYGSSPAGTLFAVLLAVWCTWRFLDTERPAWWMAPSCAAALYAATLQYSPGRIVVLILLGFLVVVMTVRWRRLEWQPALGFAMIMMAAAGVWRLQSAFETTDTFLAARGEQYFDFIQNPEYINELFDKDLLGRSVTRETITFTDKIELAYRVVETTLPQYVDLMRPIIESAPLTDITRLGALPQLYYAPLVVFIAWGLTHSLLRLRDWRHACLLIWVGAATVPLLLTNRVDSHRIMLFVIPLSLWGAFGIWEAACVLAHAQVPLDVRHFFAAVLAVTVVYNDVHLLHRTPRPNTASEAIAAEVVRLPGRVVVGALLDHREMAWLELALHERTRCDRSRAGKMLDERTTRSARDRAVLTDASAQTLRALIEDATVILAPADRFRHIAATLHNQGVRVAERGQGKFHLLRLDAGAAATGVSDEEVQPWPTLVIQPTPARMPSATER